MKRIFSKIRGPRVRHAALWLDKTIEGNTGWLIAFVIVFFGFITLSRQSANRQALEDIQTTAENTQQVAQTTKDILAGQGRAVQELKDDNEQQTQILCRLILRGDVPLGPNEEAEIERICQEAITNANNRESSSPESGGEDEPVAEAQPSQGRSPAAPERPTPGQPETPPLLPEPAPSFVDQVRERFNGLLNFIGL